MVVAPACARDSSRSPISVTNSGENGEQAVAVERHRASFRDPSGFVFTRGGVLYRQVTAAGADDYTVARASALWAQASREGRWLPVEEVDRHLGATADAYAVLRPEPLPLITYPSEWSFGMLKDAALLTLELQLRALDEGLSLKDASAFNIQWLKGRPVFIDSLSLERVVEGQPWIAYAQFCRHFLAPLALMARVDVRLQDLLSASLDGIPLDLPSRLLPAVTRMSMGLGLHLHAHARAVRGQSSGHGSTDARLSAIGQHALLKNLERTIQDLDWDPRGTEWANYYAETNYTPAAAAHKATVVKKWLGQCVRPDACVVDLGANNGRYSRMAVELGYRTLAVDHDHAAVEQAYRVGRKEGWADFLPLRMDLVNPTPARGWNHDEREPWLDRARGEVVLALALVHHLLITHHLPLGEVILMLLRLAPNVLVEWVPADDSQVARLLSGRRDGNPLPSEAEFRAAIEPLAEIVERVALPESGRSLWWIRRR